MEIYSRCIVLLLAACTSLSSSTVVQNTPTDLILPVSTKRQEPKIRQNSKVDLSGDLLPDRLPSGDPAHYALPIFLEEPVDDFVVKSRPASLQCKVAHALSVHFQCNDEVIPSSDTTNHVDPESGIRYTEAKAMITRDQVEEFFGDYHCGCVAVSGQGMQKSRLVQVTNAFLKKEFEVPPYSDQSLQGKQVELRCHPPKGKPEPNISWMKNNRKIDESDSNFIVTTEGHLIIISARMEDTANYTCVAENLANIRYSPPAELTVYVTGGWSAWSSWSSCSATCGKGGRKRGRVCNNPIPRNGQKICPGAATQKKLCDLPNCAGIDGRWSTWSSWSSCGHDCKKKKTRSCSNPAPRNGGHSCFGDGFAQRYCSGGLCKAAEWVKPKEEEPRQEKKTTESNPDLSGHLPLFIGLSVACLLFILLILFAAIFIRKRRQPGYTLTTSAYEGDQRKKVLGYSPDLTSGVSTDFTSVCYEYRYPDSNSNHKKAAYGRPKSEHHYEQPIMLGILPPSRSPVDSIGKSPMSETSSSSAGYGNISPRSGGSFDRPTNTPMTSTPLPRCSGLPDPRFSRRAALTYTGDRISLPDSSVSLTVPERAVEAGKTQDVTITVKYDSNTAPQLKPSQTLISPVVVCVSADTSKKLNKPVIISLPHCASLRHANWTVSVYQSDASEDNSSWRKVLTLGQETINTPIYAQLDINMCHIITDNISAFTLVGESASHGHAFKSLRIATFAQEFPQGSDLTVRVYCVQDTDDAIKFVTETEKKFGGRMLDKPVTALFEHGGENLCLRMDRLTEGWRTQPGADLQEVPFSHVWGYNPSLHCSFTLRHTDPLKRKLGMQINISQKGNTHRCLLKINTNISAGSGQSDSQSGSDKTKLTPIHETPAPVFRLPAQTKDTLSRMLDFPMSGGNDWRMLTERLNVHHYITFFATRPSPTEAVLNLWEARNRDSGATVGLVNILRGMGRFDAAHLLEHDLDLNQNS